MRIKLSSLILYAQAPTLHLKEFLNNKKENREYIHKVVAGNVLRHQDFSARNLSVLSLTVDNNHRWIIVIPGNENSF